MPSSVWFAAAAALALAMAVLAIRSLRARRKVAEVGQRGQATLARIGRQLLARFDQDALTEALDLLRLATGATATFVAENSGDRGSGPVAVVTQVSAETDRDSALHWKLPYLQHREKAVALAEGEVVRLDEILSIVLGRSVDEVYALAVPVSVDGEWSGFLGIAFERGPNEHHDPDLSMLETVAAMVGSFIEKRQTQERLEQAIRSRDQFLASVSHEIRTPLTSVLGFTALLRSKTGNLSAEEADEIVSLIHHQAQEVADLVEDLLVAARAEIDAISVTTDEVDLAAQVQGVLEGRLGTENKDIFVAASPEHRALADPIRVRQIIRNLVTNALRYGGDQITVTTHRDGSEVSLVFSDNGPGIPPELGRRIFDPYERAGSGPTRPESVGLGLSVSRQLARLMGGDLMLRSDLGPATFLLTLPVARSRPTPTAASGVRAGQQA